MRCTCSSEKCVVSCANSSAICPRKLWLLTLMCSTLLPSPGPRPSKFFVVSSGSGITAFLLKVPSVDQMYANETEIPLVVQMVLRSAVEGNEQHCSLSTYGGNGHALPEQRPGPEATVPHHTARPYYSFRIRRLINRSIASHMMVAPHFPYYC